MSGEEVINQSDIDLIANSNVALFILADNFPFTQVENILKKKYSIQGVILDGSFGPSAYISASDIFLEEDELFEGVPSLSGGFSISSIDVSKLPGFVVIASAKVPELVDKLVPTIAVLRK